MEKIMLRGADVFRDALSSARSIYHACILTGEADGVVWGESGTDAPSLLVFSPFQDGFQFMGAPIKAENRAGFRRFFDGTILPFLRERELDYFEYGVDTAALSAMLPDLFPDRNILSEPQKLFEWSGECPALPLPDGYRTVRVDEAFLQADYENMDFVLSEMESAYGRARLPANGRVYAALCGNRIVAQANMLFVYDGCGSIGVATEEAHRKRGLSSRLTALLIDEMRGMGLRPVWDCTEDNEASERTAIKCGFRPTGADPISWFRL